MKLNIVSGILVWLFSGVSFGQNLPDRNSITISPKSSDSPVQNGRISLKSEVVPLIYRERPAPRYPDSAKSEDQKKYQAKVRAKLDEHIIEIENLKDRIDRLKAYKRSEVLPFLRTAEGNRSVARTKLNQLDFYPPDQWTAFRSGIDRAMKNLEESIVTLAYRLPEP
ncbi:MAG: hypothetical protein H7249_02310 [Chitinophagaceae bacterium]|nr:hypothetical protein [Oligoflexus sp.]